MKHYKTVTDIVKCSRELFMMTYMDLNHIAAIHLGLNSWVEAREAKFDFLSDRSFQEAPYNQPVPKQGAYRKYAEDWVYYTDTLPPFGAKWACYYPYVMREEYPGIIVHSAIDGDGGELINTLEFFSTTHSNEITESAIAAYMETAAEDKIATENLEYDRKWNRKGQGTFHPILPSGVAHWRKWMATNTAPTSVVPD